MDQLHNLQDQLKKRWPDLTLELSCRTRTLEGARTGTITIGNISLPENLRGQGIGSEVMRSLCNYADQENLQLALTPDLVYGGSSLKRLRSFYAGFGFFPNKGRRLDGEIMEAMRREPAAIAPKLDPLSAEGLMESEPHGDMRPSL